MESGRAVQLHCSIDAKPAETSVRWIRSNAVVGTERLLELSAVSVADAGAYTCSAENEVGEKKQELELDVLYAPQVRAWDGLSDERCCSCFGEVLSYT